MKLISFLSLLFLSFNCFSQSNYECPCSQIGLDAAWADSNKVTCYSIPVPRDASKKLNGSYKLAVVVAASLKVSKQTPLLYLHGGPGIATLGNVPRYLKSSTWDLIRQDRPLVFFDYRGTGFSEPELCPGFADSLGSAAALKLSAAEREEYKIDLYKNCRLTHEKENIDISTFNSFQLAEDAESIRKLLKIEKWNVYGVSHGTTVALNLLRNHEDGIKAMILDSPFPPNASWPDFVRPFAESFKVLEKAIAEDPEASVQFPSVRNDFIKAVDSLNKVPYKIPAVNDSGATYPFTGNDFAWSIWSALLKPSSIPYVPLAIREAAKGDHAFLAKWVVAFSDPNTYGKFSDLQSKAVLCYEGRPKNESDSRAALFTAFPDFAPFNIDFESDVCNAWQPKSADSKHFEPVFSKIPVLILSGEFDPVCPPMFGELTSKTLSRATFINVPAASHAAIHADDCVREIANSFLNDPQKKVDLSCVNNRKKINFVIEDLMRSLEKLK